MRPFSRLVPTALSAFALASLALAAGSASFAPPRYHSVGDGPAGIAVADFNDDGWSDFVSVDHWGHTITAYRGDGHGGLVASGQFPTTNYPDAIAAGDLDGDGFPEVATVGEYNSDVVAIFRNRGHRRHIRFDPQVLYPVGDSPGAVTMADFDGDGRLDVAVGNRMTRDVSILRGNGDGTLEPQVRFTTSAWPRVLAAADLDNDLDLDLAVVTGELTVLLNDGDGTFTRPRHFRAGYMPFDLDTADFDGDGKLDVATANFWNGTVSVLMGNGEGGFRHESRIAVDESNLERIVAGDFTGDGFDDIVVVNGLWSTVSVLAGYGDGTFEPEQVFPGGSMQRALEKADVDRDGDLDLFVAHLAADRVSVLANLQPTNGPVR